MSGRNTAVVGKGTPNQALHLAEPHCPRVASASISCGIPYFCCGFGTLCRATALYANGIGMSHAVSKLLARKSGGLAKRLIGRYEGISLSNGVGSLL